VKSDGSEELKVKSEELWYAFFMIDMFGSVKV